MSTKISSLPSYEELFGQLEFKKGDEARSVYSPAAYLVDLLQLLDDKFEAPHLDKKRTDIQNILLTAQNTFAETPYLDIVNEVLETAIGGDVYATLKEDQYPFQLPFDLDNEKVKKYLHYLEVSAEQIYKHFALQPDSATIAREFLGLSQAEYTFLMTPLDDETKITLFYQTQSLGELAEVGRFLRTTNLTGAGLRELLFQNLSEEEKSLATSFFIHDGLNGYVTLDPEEKNLIWSKASLPIPPAWFDRVNRFVRLANKSDLSFSDVDLILRNCCGNQLNAAAIRTIAIVKQLHQRCELPVDVICSFFSLLNTLGVGNEATPQDLFNRIFNVKFAAIDQKYIAGATSTPSVYAKYEKLTCSGDLLAADNKPYCRRLSKALGISDRDLTYIVTQFRSKYTATPQATCLGATAEIGLPALSLLHRITKLAEVLDLSYAELFGLLDLLEKDPTIRQANHFNLLFHADVQTLDCYQILESGNLPAALWLVQVLFALAQWMQANDFTSAELNQILTGRYQSVLEKTNNRNQKIAGLDNLYQQFKTVILTADLFVSDRFNERAARVIYAALTEQSDSLVCQQDHRLVRFDADRAAAVAYQAINQFEAIRKEDFQQVGLEQRLLDKIFANLIGHGYLTAEGEIVEAMLPADPAQGTLTTDFSAQAASLFTLIHDFYVDAAQDQATSPDNAMSDDLQSGDEEPDDAQMDDEQSEEEQNEDEQHDDEQSEEEQNDVALVGADDIEVAFFPSDLEALEMLSAAQRNELYDNLIFNGYLDAEGNLLQTAFFAEPENVADFAVNVDLTTVAPAVFQYIAQRVKQFEAKPLALDPALFAELALTATQIDDLVENLRFNEYIDQANVFSNKRTLLALPVDQLNLALAFYPQRRQILAALQAQINECKADFYTIVPEELRTLADAAVAQQVMERLAVDYVRNNQVNEEWKAFFLDRENLGNFALGADFSASDHALIFDQIASILVDQQKYQLPLHALEELNFDVEETAELLELLIAQGNLTEALLLPADKISYFLNSNNALVFSIEAFTDYNKDIFFILHALAKESAASIEEIVAKIKVQAESQVQVVFDGLQEALAVEVDLLKVACHYLLRGLDHVVEEFMLPVLAMVDHNDAVAAEPDNSRFNLIYKRLRQFSLLANKLQLSPEEAEIVWRDQDLVEKFPEKLILPEGVDRVDALLESPEGVIYLFKHAQYWVYSAKTYHLLTLPPGVERVDALEESPQGVTYLFNGKRYWAPAAQAYQGLKTPGRPLHSLSDRLAGVTQIDAAFTDSKGTCYLVAGESYFYKEKASTRWVKKARRWGQIQSNFADPARIDTAFQDKEGKTYLFAGDQYIRYAGADYQHVDEGYPRRIAGNWEKEGLNAQLPDPFKEAIDASFQGTDDKTYLFKHDQYVASDALAEAREIRAKWGKVRNNFDDLKQLDAAYTDGVNAYFFAGDQVIAYQDSIENDQVCMREGYPQRIETHFTKLPAEFESSLEAAFMGRDGQVHLFKDGKTVAFRPEETARPVVPIRTRWGVVTNKILQTGKVDAALVGLDGKTYLFSDDQYVRYSGADYTQVDEGYPRLIANDWGGLQKVDAAFVLDGKTYLFGADSGGQIVYVCYSKKEYTVQDEGYPKAPNDNWWNLPAKLVQEGAKFERIDTVFSGKDNRTYLFSGDQFIVFDNKHRWWSEPQPIRAQWDSIPFAGVDAAFVGKDGKTYIFYGQQYIRYSTSNYSKIDDRYPNAINTYWGNVVNNIAKTGKVDAALVVESHEVINGVAQTHHHTYLFAGNQYFRYVGDQYTTVENGYPKYIATSLKTEPRFKSLLGGFENGIDAAFADRRNLYLFKGAQCQVLSEAPYQVYDQLGFAKADCAFLEDGALLIEEASVWQRYSALEGQTVEKTPVAPATLRSLPDKFKHDLDAVLQGVDHNTYLFKGPDCFNVQLNKEYPLAEEWGRPQNNIYLTNRVDAAFVGRDHKTYLFSDTQFFTYSGQVYRDAEIDEPPKLIKDHWGGLTSVALAYVKEQKTYLFEKADLYGNFRYVCYSTNDYRQPDAGFPKTATMDFWQIPENYRAEGFTKVTAVLFEGDNMFLLSHDQYIQFNDKTNLWSYPRPLHRIWRGIPLDKLTFPAIKTAFTGADGATYFFSVENYVRYSNQTFTRPLPIRESWGLAHNNFVHNRNRNKLDAAFVYQQKITYLFSGDQYVRYSGADYRYVDEGYPKLLVGNLRQEEGFKHLPATFEDVLIDRIASGADPVIDAVVANDRTLCLLIGGQCHVVSQSVTATYDLSLLGRVKNHLVDQNHVDASFVGKAVNGYRPTFLFSGDQYVRYSTEDYTYVDDGYPRAIATGFASEMGVAALPASFNEGLDAALRGADDQIYLFKGKQYLTLGDATPAAIRDAWGKVNNRFVDNPAATTLDAGLIAPAGGLYLFKGNQYIRYQTPDQEFVDEGYPKTIKDNWGNLPVEFETALDGAFVFEGKTYLVKGDAYVRYSDNSYQRIDSIYPQAFNYRWGDWADYLLSDIKTIARFKELQDAHSTAAGSLVEFLNPPPGVIKNPFEMLAAIFGWDLDEIKWLKRRNGFLSGAPLFEQEFQLELIIKLFDIFATAKKLGAAPSDLFANVWQKCYPLHGSTPAALDQAATTLYRYLAQNQSEQDWPVLARQIHDELNVIRRDILMPVLIAQGKGIENARDLYERYLIDVEMGSSGVTSRIEEAIAATQLYVHRYFVNLEEIQAKDKDREEETRRALKNWWKWMKNYRVWEANRKVFLYPENYIRPELRDTKTPAFKTLEEDLLQGEITAATVQRAFQKYLDEYTEVSRLTIAGGYVYQGAELDSASHHLVLFGRTKSDPRRYYYRLAEFAVNKDGSDATSWTPWLNVNVQIDADKVYPVYAFERVFVFWAKVETVPSPTPTTALTSTQDGATQTVSAAQPTYVIKIYYSFYNLNKEWAPAQTLTAEIKFDGSITDLENFTRTLKLFVENSGELHGPERVPAPEKITINCTYLLYDTELNSAFSLTPDFSTESAAAVGKSTCGPDLFSEIFDEPEITIAPSLPKIKLKTADIVMFNTLENSAERTWFSFDYKGGSFLCKPVEPPPADRVWPNRLSGNQDGLPAWPTIDAAFTVDGKHYFFNNADHTYVIAEDAKLGDPQLIATRWGRVGDNGNIAATGVVDAALMLGGKAYLFSGDQYLTYSNGLDVADAAGPQLLLNNHDDHLPKWRQVKAAFTGLDGNTYFFNPQTKMFMTVAANGQRGEEVAVTAKWGKMRDGAVASVTLAFWAGDSTYLVYGKQYVRFAGADYINDMPSKPQGFTELSALEGLEFTTVSSINLTKVTNAFYYDSALYFQVSGKEKWQTLTINVEQPKGNPFFKHLDRPLQAVVFQGGKLYVFKRNTENGKPFTTLCVYDVNSKKWEQHTIRFIDQAGNPIKIDQALVGKDGAFYLFSGHTYMKSADLLALISTGAARSAAATRGDHDDDDDDDNDDDDNDDNDDNDGGGDGHDDAAATALSISWLPAAGTIAHAWLHSSSGVNRIASTGLVDAAFVRGQHTYLFSGDEYIRYTDAAYDLIDEGYPKGIQGNDEALPAWDQMDAIFKVTDDQLYFFDNRDQTFVEGDQLTNKHATRLRWGRLSNQVSTMAQVDVAYVRDNYLYLISGNHFVRYTLTDGKLIGDFVDAGYPKSLDLRNNSIWPNWPDLRPFEWLHIDKIDAAFTHSADLYLLAGARYFKLAPGVEPDALPSPHFIQGAWGNLPAPLQRGVDGSFQDDDTLYLFKGNQYAKYTKNTTPFDMVNIKYDIIRLTTSTAYILNQKLLAGGVTALLALTTQEIDELPSFSEGTSTPTNIKVRPNKVSKLPVSSHLDFDSANGLYYWEIFFHAPFLIAQALNTGQKFEEAKEWYEYIFDPTERADYWKFLPFLTVDIQALIDSCTGALQELKALMVDIRSVDPTFTDSVFKTLAPVMAVFQQRGTLSKNEEDAFSALQENVLKPLAPVIASLRDKLNKPDDVEKNRRGNKAITDLQERVAIMGKLWQRYELLGNQAVQIQTYLNDPFDPHAIAALRPTAYRKAIVMAYVDNLLDWGDMLFRQYTRESINEARMLYILAYDLLGEKPENLGAKLLDAETTYAGLQDSSPEYDLILYRANARVVGNETLQPRANTLNTSVGNPYFFVPDNRQFSDYWSRVEDRLYKIRHSLNILGISQPLPLFEPPIDPMALVQAVSSGAALSSALASLNIPVPHYRFSFMLRKAQELVQKLNGFGGDLLGALEKKDAEELSLLQNRQEGLILTMTRAIKEAQVQVATATVQELKASLNGANSRREHYEKLLDEGLLPVEQAQITLMSAAAAAHLASTYLKVGAAIAYVLPQAKIGPFIIGTEVGGKQVGDAVGKIAEVAESLGEGLSVTGEVLGTFATHLRTEQDWKLQLSTAESDIAQITHQLAGAEWQVQIAQRELAIHEQEIAHNAAIKSFMQGKFSNAQLYQWMISKLSDLYFQSYSLAYDMAKSAEKAFQFERGQKESEVNYIQPLYWESQKNGLLAGESLGLDLDHMEKAYIDSDSRGFEITKNISLLALDPVALLQLKSKGVCEFSLTEALFDYDFPGHYCRQVKTVSLTFAAGEEQRLPVNATLTQLGHKTVLEPDAKAVKYLLDPKDQPPLTLRSDWKANQQIALSHVGEGQENNGLFELRFDDDQYLPFEGTGAVSTWRLELNGKKGAYNVNDLFDVIMTLKYTAEQGGALFATAVKGMLKPYPTARFFDVANEFPDEWAAFMENEDDELVLPLSRDLFPDMSGGKITGLFARYELAQPGTVSMVLNGDKDLTLKDGKFVLTNGLSISSRGSEWAFMVNGDKNNLENISLVVGYTAKVS